MIFVIQRMRNNKKIPLGYTDSWQKAEEMLEKLERCKHDPKYGSVSYSIYPLDELPDKIPKEWK